MFTTRRDLLKLTGAAALNLASALCPIAVFYTITNILIGKPSLGSWLSYGLGTDNEDLPSFVRPGANMW